MGTDERDRSGRRRPPSPGDGGDSELVSALLAEAPDSEEFELAGDDEPELSRQTLDSMFERLGPPSPLPEDARLPPSVASSPAPAAALPTPAAGPGRPGGRPASQGTPPPAPTSRAATSSAPRLTLRGPAALVAACIAGAFLWSAGGPGELPAQPGAGSPGAAPESRGTRLPSAVSAERSLAPRVQGPAPGSSADVAGGDVPGEPGGHGGGDGQGVAPAAAAPVLAPGPEPAAPEGAADAPSAQPSVESVESVESVASVRVLSRRRARVYLRGELIGWTPADFQVPPGRHRLVIKPVRAESYRRTIRVKAGESRELRLR